MELGEKWYFSSASLNNSRKSSVLQSLLAKSQNSNEIPAERGTVRPTIHSGGLPLNQYVEAFKNAVSSAPLDTAQFGQGSVNYGNTIQIRQMNSYLECFLPSMIRDKGVTDSITELRDYVKRFLLGESINDRGDQLL